MGKPIPTCDTKAWYNTYKSYIKRTSGFVSLEGGGCPPAPATQNHSFASPEREGMPSPPSCDTKPRSCVANKALDPNQLFAVA